ncbi:MAG: RagB/SusD family nutrient uptake outer membrane protein [Bacteroidales bacterium]|nr:RagB/SusD family nutrient uptake outer membrane protein [Bacteroidales bacterium]
MKNKFLYKTVLGLVAAVSFSSCQEMFEADAEHVLFTEDVLLDHPTDTVYSVVGILSKLQTIADRTVLLGELRGDMMQLTPDATLDLQALANFTADTKNEYNKPQDYYAIINNCNYFLAYADTTLRKRNEPIFLKEYAVVKAFRAWTYLQLAQVYGEVPFVTEPILTEKQASKTYPKKGIVELCDYFIEDLLPYINTPLPGYGTIGSLNSQYYFFPIRVLLGDFCLWSGRYTEAAQYYKEYLTDRSDPKPIGSSRVEWYTQTNTFEHILDSYSGVFGTIPNSEYLCAIPMESNSFEGLVSDLSNVFSSTQDNYYYYQAEPSIALRTLSKNQSNCKVYVNQATATRDTLYAPEEPFVDQPLTTGDLRLWSIYSWNDVSTGNDRYSTKYQFVYKVSNLFIPTYRKTQIYLRYAEAMNRAGYPTAAFAVLKHGLTNANVASFVDSTEILAASGTTLLTWDVTYFTAQNTIGIHSKGSGDAAANKFYVIPELASREDSILFVEDKIVDELALETTFEGYRFFDLMRVALRRDDASYLASKVAGRYGADNFSQDLYDRLLVRSNWYLPLR